MKKGIKVYQKAYRQKHREELLVKKKTYRQEHKKGIKVYQKAYYQKHKEENLARCRSYRQKHKKKVKAWAKAYRQKHREERLARFRSYYQKHKKEAKAWVKAYRQKYRKKYLAYTFKNRFRQRAIATLRYWGMSDRKELLSLLIMHKKIREVIYGKVGDERENSSGN